jgi:hypothetical protein
VENAAIATISAIPTAVISAIPTAALIHSRTSQGAEFQRIAPARKLDIFALDTVLAGVRQAVAALDLGGKSLDGS